MENYVNSDIHRQKFKILDGQQGEQGFHLRLLS